MRAVIVARLFPLFVSVLRDVRWIWWGRRRYAMRRYQRRAQYLLDTVTALGYLRQDGAICAGPT
jgi:membrane protein required for beta-lactamase induction